MSDWKSVISFVWTIRTDSLLSLGDALTIETIQTTVNTIEPIFNLLINKET